MSDYDPDKSSEHSSRGSSHDDGASQILRIRDSPAYSERWHDPANSQGCGAPAATGSNPESEGNYMFSRAYYEAKAQLAQEKSGSQRPQSPRVHNLNGTRGIIEQPEHENSPVNIPRIDLKRALSGDSPLDCKSDSDRLQLEPGKGPSQSRRDFARDITNSSQVEFPPAKKRRTANTNGDKERLAGLGKEIVMILQEQTALLARVFDAVSEQ